jgi:hypothetical protein
MCSLLYFIGVITLTAIYWQTYEKHSRNFGQIHTVLTILLHKYGRRAVKTQPSLLLADGGSLTSKLKKNYCTYGWFTWALCLPGTAVAQWLRFCTTNRKAAGSIPDGVIGFFRWKNPSDRTMALGSTQPLTEMSTRNISWGYRRPVYKADNLTTILCRCQEIWEP